MGYAIICTARAGQQKGIDFLALVDRGKTKALWWTSDDAELILNYRSKSAADYCCSRLKHNHAHVVDYADARELILGQFAKLVENDDPSTWSEEEHVHKEGMDAVEAGWDGHKDVF